MSSRCAVDETGRNSVIPCTTPRSAAAKSVTQADGVYARALRCDFGLRGGGGTAAAGSGVVAALTGMRDVFLLRMIASDGAMNQPEYVVATVPTSIVKAKPLSTSPPNRYSASTAMKTVPE